MKGWTQIRARIPSIDQVLAPFEKEMEHYLDIAEGQFEKSVGTWRNKPTFRREIIKRGTFHGTTVIQGEIGTGDTIYRYINDGTSVRYATMTRGFQAKTKPGRISAGAGSGGLAYVDRRTPRKGIKPRKFDELIAKGTERNFYSAFDRAVAAAIRRLDNP